jgi:hypothetical protein
VRQLPAPLPSLSEGNLRSPCSPSAEHRGKRRRDPNEAAQHTACVAESQAGFEVADKAEDVALAVAQRVPPAAAVMIDDDDFALAPAVFEAAATALSAVQSPDRR